MSYSKSGLAECTVSFPLDFTPGIKLWVGSFYFEENTTKYGS